MQKTAKNGLPVGFVALGVVTALVLPILLYAIFVVASVEVQQGIVQKIFYFHVPSAYAMYVGFGLCAVASGVYLANRKEHWDAIAVASAEVGLLFCIIVLTTGPLWARKPWGTWWKWDPRLTTTLLAGMVFAAYVVLRGLAQDGEGERKLAAGLALVGLFDLPIIHYSVKRWRGQHPTVITSEGGGIEADMVPALVIGFVFFTLLAALLIWFRARAERIKREVKRLERAAAQEGLLEDV